MIRVAKRFRAEWFDPFYVGSPELLPVGFEEGDETNGDDRSKRQNIDIRCIAWRDSKWPPPKCETIRKYIMFYEVELKYAVSEVQPVLENLEWFGLYFGKAVEEHDTFYQHPAKDFVVTDECLRIRHRAGEYHITYKGPKIDRETKTRQEIELFLTDNAKTARLWNDLLQALGFRAVAELKKTRRSAGFVYQEHKYELTLDHIEGLGDFIELETIADSAQLDHARRRIKLLAAMLGLTHPITASYLELSQAGK